jgi:hypothetical protein
VKQLFASHYFQLALDLSACVQEAGRSNDVGFYLISLKGSTQQGFTGLFSSILRRIVVSRARSAQEKSLMIIKQALEAQPQARIGAIQARPEGAQVASAARLPGSRDRR